MGDIRWYKRDPDAALAGMAELTLEERGAYNTVLDLIYSTEGKLKDDDRYISGWLRCDIRVWRRIRRRLLGLGKLHVHADCLHNKRALRELDAAQHRVLSAAEAGRSSWATRKQNMNIFNGPKMGPFKRPFELTTPTKKERKKTDLETEVGAVDKSVDNSQKGSAEEASQKSIREMRKRKGTG
jgi:uncharacterized protein YdaU (DUF1376 family)